MGRLLKTLLITFLVARQALGQQTDPNAHELQLESMTPSGCLSAGVNCTCYGDVALEKIADQLRLADTCVYEVRQYEDYSEKIDEKAWYETTTFTVGGLVVGISLAGVLGYFLGSRK